MKSGRRLIHIIFLLFTLPYIYGGCIVVFSSGDINRDKNLSHTDTAVGFIGISSQAEFNTTNAEDLVGSAFTGGSTNVEPLNRSFFIPQTAAFRPFKFPRVLIDSLRRIESAPEIITFSSTDVMIQNGNFQGDCGGSFSYA